MSETELGQVENAVAAELTTPAKTNGAAEYAPMATPERLEATAKLAGDTIRAAGAATSKSLRDLLEQAQTELDTIKAETEEFIKQHDDLVGSHAERIESALGAVRNLATAIAQQREAVTRMAVFGNDLRVVNTQP
jgi:DNA anti-recombination protein RmuC